MNISENRRGCLHLVKKEDGFMGSKVIQIGLRTILAQTEARQPFVPTSHWLYKGCFQIKAWARTFQLNQMIPQSQESRFAALSPYLYFQLLIRKSPQKDKQSSA